jgi:hypothetical protein
MYIAQIHFSVDYLVKKKSSTTSKTKESYNVEELMQLLLKQFALQFFVVGQKFIVEVNKQNLVFTAVKLTVADLDAFVSWLFVCFC